MNLTPPSWLKKNKWLIPVIAGGASLLLPGVGSALGSGLVSKAGGMFGGDDAGGVAPGGSTGWTSALDKVGSYGAQQGMNGFSRPEQAPMMQPPTQLPPQQPMGSFSPEGDMLRQQQLARLRAYFTPAVQGGGGNGFPG